MISSRAAKTLCWSDTSHQNFTRDLTADVRLAPAALQVTLPMPNEQADATVKTNPAWFWNGCCTRVPNPVWSLQALKHLLQSGCSLLDEARGSAFALFYVLAAQSPAGHASSLQYCFLSLSVSHADSSHFGSQTKVWSLSVSQPASLNPTYLVQGWHNNPWSFWKL